MRLTTELSALPSHHDPLAAYERQFGALPFWFDDLPAGEAKQLARQALREGVPLSNACHFH